jgi:hypothetical protein
MPKHAPRCSPAPTQADGRSQRPGGQHRLSPLPGLTRGRRIRDRPGEGRGRCAAAKALLATRPVFHRTDACDPPFLALVLRKELLDRLAACGGAVPERQCIIDDLLDLSGVEVEQDGRRALLRTAPRPSIGPICRALGVTLPPVFQEVSTDKASIPPG